MAGNKKGEINLPDNLKLVQFFYDWDEFPWETSNDGWLVKTYTTLNTSQITELAQPAELENPKFCEITFKPVQSLPDWEGIERYSKNASNLSCVLDENEPWGSYQKAVEKLIGEQKYRSQLGGYPMWVQGEDTPVKQTIPMKLLFQIDSEDNAGIMWGDVDSERIEFTLQCH